MRYEDGIDRCPDCAAVIPQPEPLEVGTISRAVEHRAWCPRLRISRSYVTMIVPSDLDGPPAPGPVWSNGLDESDDPAGPGYTAADLDAARTTLEVAFAQQGPYWAIWTLGHLTATAALTEPRRTGEVLALLAALHEVTEWPSTYTN